MRLFVTGRRDLKSQRNLDEFSNLMEALHFAYRNAIDNNNRSIEIYIDPSVPHYIFYKDIVNDEFGDVFSQMKYFTDP